MDIDGAVRQRCVHRDTTLQELDDLLSEYDMKRDLAEINRKAPQWAHKAVWNKWYMEPKTGLTLSQMWTNAEADIKQKTSRSNEIRDSDLRRVASAATSLPTPKMADSPFLKALGTDKPLSEAQALVDDPDAFMLEVTKIIQNKHSHPVIAQMLH